MKKTIVGLLLGVAVVIGSQGSDLPGQEGTLAADWSFNASLIEACSCPVFCPCFFNTMPAAHGGHEGGGHFCRFNVAYQVNKGHSGKVDLKGARFWLAGDLGDSFADSEAEWSVMTFDPGVTKDQRAAIQSIVKKIYPIQWKSFELGADAKIAWERTETFARASLDGGRIAEIALKPSVGMGGKPVVMQNVKYNGAARNDGLVIMPNEIEAYRAGDRPFAFKGTTGFTTTVDVSSKDL